MVALRCIVGVPCGVKELLNLESFFMEDFSMGLESGWKPAGISVLSGSAMAHILSGLMLPCTDRGLSDEDEIPERLLECSGEMSMPPLSASRFPFDFFLREKNFGLRIDVRQGGGDPGEASAICDLLF